MSETKPPDLGNPLTVGGTKLRNRVFLAPMSGVTDLAFRELSWRHGAGLVVSEMVASQALVEGEAEMDLKVRRGNVSLHVVQLAGREAGWMSLAAKMAEDNGAGIVDINMGCPAKRVTTGYSGSALMRDLDHALTLIEAVVGAVSVPVTLKMRLGWDDQSLNAAELAARAQDAGIQMITVHGRTRCQFYKGSADWEKVAAVREAISVPLVVNGDIVDAETAYRALTESGADAVMIGRGSYGAPWLPGELAGNIAGSDKMDHGSTVLAHYEAMLSLYGKQAGVRQARKHLAWYMDRIKPVALSNQLRKRILTEWEPEVVLELLTDAFADAADTSSVQVREEKVAA